MQCNVRICSKHAGGPWISDIPSKFWIKCIAVEQLVALRKKWYQNIVLAGYGSPISIIKTQKSTKLGHFNFYRYPPMDLFMADLITGNPAGFFITNTKPSIV